MADQYLHIRNIHMADQYLHTCIYIYVWVINIYIHVHIMGDQYLHTCIGHIAISVHTSHTQMFANIGWQQDITSTIMNGSISMLTCAYIYLPIFRPLFDRTAQILDQSSHVTHVLM